MSQQVQGFCPMGCGETLFLGSSGFVTCAYLPCPNPTAVSDLLADRETEHIVELGDGTFTVRHGRTASTVFTVTTAPSTGVVRFSTSAGRP